VGTQQRFVVGARSQCVAKQCVLVATLVQKVVLMAHVRQGKIRGSVVARSTREDTWLRGCTFDKGRDVVPWCTFDRGRKKIHREGERERYRDSERTIRRENEKT
jgi:hypothetical protein